MENTEEPDVDNESEKGIGSALQCYQLWLFCGQRKFLAVNEIK